MLLDFQDLPYTKGVLLANTLNTPNPSEIETVTCSAL